MRLAPRCFYPPDCRTGLKSLISRDVIHSLPKALADSLRSMSQDRTHDIAQAMSRLEHLLEILAIALLVYLTIWGLAP
jgi:hypothetical protein